MKALVRQMGPGNWALIVPEVGSFLLCTTVWSTQRRADAARVKLDGLSGADRAKALAKAFVRVGGRVPERTPPPPPPSTEEQGF